MVTAPSTASVPQPSPDPVDLTKDDTFERRPPPVDRAARRKVKELQRQLEACPSPAQLCSEEHTLNQHIDELQLSLNAHLW